MWVVGRGVCAQGDHASCPSTDCDLQDTLCATLPSPTPLAMWRTSCSPVVWARSAYFTWSLPWEAGGAEIGALVREGARTVGSGAPTPASLARCGAALLLMCLSSSHPALSWAPWETGEVRLRASLSKGSQPRQPFGE